MPSTGCWNSDGASTISGTSPFQMRCFSANGISRMSPAWTLRRAPLAVSIVHEPEAIRWKMLTWRIRAIGTSAL